MEPRKNENETPTNDTSSEGTEELKEEELKDKEENETISASIEGSDDSGK